MCEQGQLHMDKVKFDQVNNAGMEGGDHLWRQRNFYLELGCVAGCCSGGLRTPLPELGFQRRKIYFLCEISEEYSGADFTS